MNWKPSTSNLALFCLSTLLILSMGIHLWRRESITQELVIVAFMVGALMRERADPR